MTKYPSEYHVLREKIKHKAQALGFQQLGVSDIDLTEHEQHLQQWLAQGFHGDMAYMHKHGSKRTRPAELENYTLRVISVRMDYWPPTKTESWDLLAKKHAAYVSRYATGRDYHKLMRKRLQKLADYISELTDDHQYRVFVDSAPVMEKALAEKAGLGWIGKHSNLINRKAGSWFFLGEIYTNLPLPSDQQEQNHCGSCRACLDVCPTQAIVAPYTVDARKCISYLTIELQGAIPESLRPGLGNRIYGCDDCQLICPWNRFSKTSSEPDFAVRHGLDKAELLDLFAWSEAEFEQRMAGSAIRRIGFQRWQRNIAVALGNSDGGEKCIAALKTKLADASPLVAEHIEWALAQLTKSA